MASKEVVQAAEAYSYPVEHIGHLKPHQVEALEKFKAFCADKGYYRPEAGGAKASHDDETMLRYLRARKYSVQEAWKQFKDTEDWRKENQIDKLYECIDVNEYDEARRLYPQWTGRRDKRGIPLYVYEVQHLTAKAVAAYEGSTSKPGAVQSKLPPKMLKLFALYENLCNFALPLCTFIPERMYPQTPVSQSSNIVDISNVSLKQFWNLKTHMQDASTLATAHYPETLDRIFIIGAPSFFPTVWGWIKRWFDPITVSKIFILSKATALPTLLEFVDRADIPKKYGGDLDFEFGDLPNIDGGIHANLKWINPATEKHRNTFPTGPIKWAPSPTTGAMTATAVGSVNGQMRSVEIASIIDMPPSPIFTRKSPIPPTQALERLPSAVETHPPSPPSDEVDLSNPPSAATTPASSVRGTPTPAHTTASLNHSAAPIPYRQHVPTHDNTSHQPPAPSDTTPKSPPPDIKHESRDDTTDTVRSGTTSTRFEQQSSTHGHRQLEEHTPDVRQTIDGDKHGVMEPSTVSQAPKEHPLPPQEEEAGPGMLAQVKGTLTSVATTALNVVGLDNGGKDDQPVAGVGERDAEGQGKSKGTNPTGKDGVGHGDHVDPTGGKRAGVEGDEEVDNARPEQVEEFLRSGVRSKQGQKVLD